MSKLSRKAIFPAAVILGAASLFAAPAMAQSVEAPAIEAPVKSSSPVTNLLGNASDSALDDLAKPGAFFADKAIRIALPGATGGILKKGLSFGNKLGITNDITKSINDAAGLAAGEAKPIFRNAINGLSVKDIPTLVGKSDGGTQYLRQSAGDELTGKIRPLVAKALGDVGAFKQLDKLGGKSSLLGGVGLNSDGLTDSVTKQTLNGIFKYMGNEERSLRKNPINAGKKIFNIFK